MDAASTLNQLRAQCNKQFLRRLNSPLRNKFQFTPDENQLKHIYADCAVHLTCYQIVLGKVASCQMSCVMEICLQDLRQNSEEIGQLNERFNQR